MLPAWKTKLTPRSMIHRRYLGLKPVTESWRIQHQSKGPVAAVAPSSGMRPGKGFQRAFRGKVGGGSGRTGKRSGGHSADSAENRDIHARRIFRPADPFQGSAPDSGLSKKKRLVECFVTAPLTLASGVICFLRSSTKNDNNGRISAR